MSEKSAVFYDDENQNSIEFEGDYEAGTSARLYPLEDAHPADGSYFETRKVFFNNKDITELFDLMVEKNWIDIEKLDEDILKQLDNE